MALLVHKTAPNRKWIADFTYVWTAQGWLYVAAVIDLFSRRVVGWSMSAEMTAQLLRITSNRTDLPRPLRRQYSARDVNVNAIARIARSHKRRFVGAVLGLPAKRLVLMRSPIGSYPHP